LHHDERHDLYTSPYIIVVVVVVVVVVVISLVPQPKLGLGLLHKIRLNFLEASQQFSFYRIGLLAPRQTPIPENQTSVFYIPQRQGGYPF
jgi:hypothetical protein